MIERKSGSIIMISSDAGKVGEANMAVYGGAKAAINHLAKCLVQEISRYNIRINAVSPGTAKTPMAVSSGWLTPEREAKIAKIFPMGRLTEVSDVVDCVAFLASDKAKFITGQVVSVSGGYS
jgi:NAD(P)-dependent dehydrogenase (short-subunit alcohol dehydrogenase family)